MGRDLAREDGAAQSELKNKEMTFCPSVGQDHVQREEGALRRDRSATRLWKDREISRQRAGSMGKERDSQVK